MLPIVFNPATAAIGLAGAGEGLSRRQALLEGAGVMPVHVAPEAPGQAISALTLLFVAGLDPASSARLAGLARNLGVPVNVEDAPELCDFHVPAAVRRGDLLLTVSTGGRAPGLSRIVREWLEDRFGSEWALRLDDLSGSRAAWRDEGLPPSAISAKTREMVARKGWLS